MVSTLYRIVKRSVAEGVPDRASVHTRNVVFEAVSVPEQYCSDPLLKVERSVSDRFLKRPESSLSTFIFGGLTSTHNKRGSAILTKNVVPKNPGNYLKLRPKNPGTRKARLIWVET